MAALSTALAAEVLSIRMTQLDQADRDQLVRLLLDHAGCGLRGAVLPWGLQLRRWAAPYAKVAGAPLYFCGEQQAPAFVAALVNGGAAHGLELDDTHDESVSHPGAVVISAVLAKAAELNASGDQICQALVGGYETMARVGAAVGAGDMILRGFHPTAVFGAFGATAACARLLDFTPKQLAGAWGLVLSLAGGSMQFSREAEGTTVKRLHAAFAAQNGILACELTEHGLEGPLSALDGDFGVARLFGPSPDLERLAQKPARAAIHGVSFKPYPCCRLFHSTLDALAQVTDAFTLDPARIAGLEVTGPRLLVEQHMLRRPASTMAAQYQLPYTLAAALFFGPQNEDGFAAAARADPRLAAIEDKVTAERDDEFDAAFPRHFGSSISVTLTDGEVRQTRVLDSLGTPVNPLSDDALTEKTRGLLFAAGASVTADALRQACRVLVERSDPSHLMQALAHG